MSSKKPLLRVVAPFAIFAIVLGACTGGDMAACDALYAGTSEVEEILEALP